METTTKAKAVYDAHGILATYRENSVFMHVDSDNRAFYRASDEATGEKEIYAIDLNHFWKDDVIEFERRSVNIDHVTSDNIYEVVVTHEILDKDFDIIDLQFDVVKSFTTEEPAIDYAKALADEHFYVFSGIVRN